MALEVIDWGAPPEGRDGDDSTTYVMGAAFEVTAPVPCSALEWEVPDDVTPAPGSVDGKFWASLWEDATRVRVVEFVPVPGATQRIPFDSAFGCTVGPEYTAQILTRRYSYRTGDGFPYSTPSGVGVATGGRLSTSTDPTTRAAGASTARFYVSPVLGEESGDAVTATLTATLPAVTAEWSAAPAVGATLTATLPGLDAALSVDVEAAVGDMTLIAVMREIADVLATVPGFVQVHARPPGRITAPAAVVAYPESWERLTYGPRPARRYERIAVLAVAGPVNGAPKTVQADLSGWESSVPAAIEGRSWTSCDVVAVTGGETAVITVGGVEYLAAVFYLDAWGYRA